MIPITLFIFGTCWGFQVSIFAVRKLIKIIKEKLRRDDE